MISRRNFLGAAAFLGGAGAAAGGTALLSALEPDPIEVLETAVDIQSLPGEFTDYRIAFLSDIHLGKFLQNDFVSLAVNKINEQKPDLILLGGDYIWTYNSKWGAVFKAYGFKLNQEFAHLSQNALTQAVFKRVADITSELKAPDGIFGVYGNHDRWEKLSLCKDSFGKKGIKILRNEPAFITKGASRLAIYGFDDYWAGIPVTSGISPKKGSNEIRIFLEHNPDFICLLAETHEFNLALCGHTHGGQIILPLLGALHYNILNTAYAQGLHSAGTGQIYTSRGIGTVEIPVRINCPPEISILTLRKA